jgi:hypothetical protein
VRSYTDMDVLIAVLLVALVVMLANLPGTYVVAGWLYEGGRTFFHQAASFVGNFA